MKKVIFIAQSKGGLGKSVLTFLLGEKFKDSLIVDMDPASRTSLTQLAYRKPLLYSFRDEENKINRELITCFFNLVPTFKEELIICDLGPVASQQLPLYLKENEITLSTILQKVEIELQAFVIVGGNDAFISSFEYLKSVIDASKSADGLKIKIFKNEHFRFLSDQSDALKEFADRLNLPIIDFNLEDYGSQSAKLKMDAVMISGLGIEDSQVSIITKRYFKKGMETLNI